MDMKAIITRHLANQTRNMPTMRVQAKAIDQQLAATLRNKAVTTQPSPAWIYANVDGKVCKQIATALGVDVQPEAILLSLLQPQLLLGLGTMGIEARITTESVTVMMGSLNDRDLDTRNTIDNLFQNASFFPPSMDSMMNRQLRRCCSISLALANFSDQSPTSAA